MMDVVNIPSACLGTKYFIIAGLEEIDIIYFRQYNCIFFVTQTFFDFEVFSVILLSEIHCSIIYNRVKLTTSILIWCVLIPFAKRVHTCQCVYIVVQSITTTFNLQLSNFASDSSCDYLKTSHILHILSCVHTRIEFSTAHSSHT